jgi:DNA-binding transcriptional MerR regulator
MAEKIYYRIGEVAKKFNVAASLIRYWEQQFEFIKPHKTAKGRRYFTQQDVERFSLVYYLVKEKGMTIQGVKDYFEKYGGDKAGEKVEVLNTLKKTKDFLLEVRKILNEELEKIDNEDMP